MLEKSQTICRYDVYLPFASVSTVRQCTEGNYVMEQIEIPEDEWMTKRAALPVAE